MEFIVHAAIAIGFFIYAFVIFDKIYSSKKFRLLPKILFIAGASLVIALADTFRIPLLNSLMSFVSLLIMNNLFYKPEGKAYIIYDAMLTIISVIVEMLAVLLLAFSIGVSTEIMLDTPNLLAASAILYSIVMIAVAKSFLLLVSGKGMNNIRTHEFIMFLVLIIGEILLLHFLNDIIISSKSRYEIVIILLTFLALDLYLAYLLRTISKAYQTEKELELVTQQSMLQLNAYNELNEKYAASRRVIHDVRKHISSLEGLINANRADEAERYKDLLNAELNKLMPRFECDSPILTVVINNKLDAAEKKNVDFRVDAEFTRIDFISNLDITAIFSNLLDNAFEACAELPEENRRVWLSITRRNYFVFIYLENSYSAVTPDPEKGFRSTKKLHQGIGLSNIRSACEKYRGSFNAHTEDGMFITEVLIPIPDGESSVSFSDNDIF